MSRSTGTQPLIVRIPGRGFALVLVAVVLALVVLAGAPQQAAARDRTDAVTGWIDVELAEIAAHRTNPPRASRGLALLSVAMFKATKVPRGHQEAAVAGAASTVLTYLYADRADAFAALAVRKRPKHALAAGRRIGERVVANARTDGSDAVWQGTMPVGPGLWVPTPPAFAPPLEVLAGTWRTWNIRSGSQFLSAPPPAFGSKANAREVAEVYEVSRSLTDEQKQIANFWADGPGTVTPPGHWNQIALELIRGHRLSAPAAARVLAALNTAQADAFIACWNAKFNVLVGAAGNGDPARARPELALVHRDAAVPLVRERALVDFRSGFQGAGGVFPRRSAAAPCVGRGGCRLAPLRRDPLPQ